MNHSSKCNRLKFTFRWSVHSRSSQAKSMLINFLQCCCFRSSQIQPRQRDRGILKNQERKLLSKSVSPQVVKDWYSLSILSCCERTFKTWTYSSFRSPLDTLKPRLKVTVFGGFTVWMKSFTFEHIIHLSAVYCLYALVQCASRPTSVTKLSKEIVFESSRLNMLMNISQLSEENTIEERANENDSQIVTHPDITFFSEGGLQGF